MPVTPPAVSSPNTRSLATLNPYAFVLVMAIVTCVPYAGGNAWQWVSNPELYWDSFASYWPGMLHMLSGSVLLHATIIVLLVHDANERHPSTPVPLCCLLAIFAALYLVGLFAVDWSIRYFSQDFYRWALNQESSSLWLWIHTQISRWVMAFLACFLPLWAVLRTNRRHSLQWEERAGPGFANWQISSSVALIFSLVLFEVGSALAWKAVPWSFARASTLMSLIGGCIIPFAMVMIATGSRLPRRVPHFAVGRTVAMALALMVLWQTAVIPSAALMIRVSLMQGLGHGWADTLLLLWSALMLALLWPLSRACTRWFLIPGGGEN